MTPSLQKPDFRPILTVRLSGRTLEKHRMFGTGPTYRKIGGRVVYAIADLQAWADRGAQKSTHEKKDDRVRPARRTEQDHLTHHS